MLFGTNGGGFSPVFFNGGSFSGPQINKTGKVLLEFVATSPSITIYHDGAQVFSDADHYARQLAYNGAGCIGARLDAGSGFYDGLIAEIVIVPTGL
eukprot:scaffold52117_cov270-Isochrysis_galbana.AAC.1